METALPPPKPLTLRRWVDLYLPLALTFLLMSGSTPIINMGIGQYSDAAEKLGLAAFVNAFVLCLFLYSPCFAVRDAAQKFIRGRTSYRRTLLFLLAVSTVCTGFLLLVALTPVVDGLLLRRVMRLDAEVGGRLFPEVKQAILAFLPIPTLIVLRGVHQAVHITNESARWIGIGTALRFGMIAGFVFLVGVPIGLPGGILGGLALSLGIATEMVVNLVTARRGAAWLKADPPGETPAGYGHLWSFAGPLFLANIMGTFLQTLTLSIVNDALFLKTSGAAFSIVRSFTWFFSSTLFAMQTMALAKADSIPNLKRLMGFTLIPVAAFTLLTFLTAFVGPVRGALLHSVFRLDDVQTVDFITATLPLGLMLPLLMAVRSTARGLIMRSGVTFWVTGGSLAALLFLVTANAIGPSAGRPNGAAIGYLCWIGALGMEFLVLVVGLARLGLGNCVAERGRRPRAIRRRPPPARP